MKTETKKLLIKIADGVMVAIAVLCMTLLVYVTISLSIHKRVELFGYSLSIVVSDSMSPEINVGDMVVAKNTAKSDIAVGDDIVFVSADPKLNGKLLVHRVVGVNPDGSFATSGIKSGASTDEYPATEIVGKVAKVSTAGGRFVVKMVENKSWVFILIAALAIIIAIAEIVHIIRLAQKAKASDAAVKAVREDIKREIMQENGLSAETGTVNLDLSKSNPMPLQGTVTKTKNNKLSD